MKKINLSKNSISVLTVLAIILVAAGVLAALFPSSGDDWYWAVRDFSFKSVSELNGRYLGSFLVLLMTRFNWFKVLITAALFVALVYFSANCAKKNGLVYILFSACLLVAMPLDMFRQVIVWSSGFANYFPSILITVIYIYLINNIFSDEAPVYSKSIVVICFLLGLSGAFFMENITLGNVIVGAAVLIYTKIRFKKVNIAHIAFLVGAVIGTALMFADGAYFSILGGNGDSAADGYRDVFFGAELIKNIINVYFSTVHYNLVYNNILLNLVLTLLLLWTTLNNFKLLKKSVKVTVIACIIFNFIYIIISGFDLLGVELLPSFQYVGVVKGALTALFAASFILNFILVIRDNNLLLKGLFLVGCILAYVIPLLVVSPLGARNFFEAYVLFILFAQMLFAKNMSDSAIEVNSRAVNMICVILFTMLLCTVALYIIVYAQIYIAYVDRAESIKLQLDNLQSVIWVEKLPYEDYVWNANPYNDNSYLRDIFKEYYSIPEYVELILND